ncbi:MAG: hypothetical protein JJE09_12150 [Bacteroidia bacterium]|nr:hypothetical protein [Bacteroidia bacterium]
MRRILIFPSLFLFLFMSQAAFAQEYKVIKSCYGYYQPLEDLPDSVIAKRNVPKVDRDAEKKMTYELLPVNTRVRRLEGTYVYRVKVLTGLYKGKLLYVKTEFLQAE